MTAQKEPEKERRIFYRRPDVPGIEFLEATASAGPWSVYNVEYAIAIPESWCACLNHDGRSVDLGPDSALMIRPGELHSTSGARRAGNLRAMIFSDTVLASYLGEHLAQPTQFSWRASVARISPELLVRFTSVYRALHSAATMQFQSTLVDFFAALVPDLVADKQLSQSTAHTSRQVARMRELMHHSPEGLSMSLDQLAAAVGMTRFRALRAFKRRYGVPPHAYQLTARVQRAMTLLSRGERATDVAHELGFADHSHFTRHFKRIAGLTPRDYASAGKLPSFASPEPCTSRRDGSVYSF